MLSIQLLDLMRYVCLNTTIIHNCVERVFKTELVVIGYLL